MPEANCSNCIHWKSNRDSYWRECDLTRFWREAKHVGSRARAVAQGDSPAALLTNAEFSCNQHTKKREESNEPCPN